MDIFGKISRVLGLSEVTPLKRKSDPNTENATTNSSQEPDPESEGQTGKPFLKEKVLQASKSHEEKLLAIAGGMQEKSEGKSSEITLPLGNQNVTLKGIDIIDLAYTKRPDAEHEELRKEFNSKHRKAFMKNLANDPEKLPALYKAGLNDIDIKMMKDGKVPTGFQVHHKIPIDDSGENEPSNFVLIKNKPAHMAITNLQTKLIEGMENGDTKNFQWPVPKGFVYPPDPSMVTTSPK